MNLAAAAGNVLDRLVDGGLADLSRMPRTRLRADATGTLYRYHPLPGVAAAPEPPVLLIPPLGAPDFAYDLRRGCSLVEHLLGRGRAVYLVDHGEQPLARRGPGLEHWVDEVVPAAVADVAADADSEVHLVGWSLGGIFALLAVAAAAQDGRAGAVRSLSVIGSAVDVTGVPLLAPLRPLAAVAERLGLTPPDGPPGSFPGTVVGWAFQLTAIDKLLTRPLAVLSRLDDRDCLAQIEAVDHLMGNMRAYPGRVFGQIAQLLLRDNALADGRIELGGRTIGLSAVGVPVLVVAGRRDVIAPMRAVLRLIDLLTGAPLVRFGSAPGGHLGVLTGRGARTTTWAHLDAFLAETAAA